MVARVQSPANPTGVAAEAARDMAEVRGIASVATGESAQQVERHLQVARRVMRQNRNVLRELAK